MKNTIGLLNGPNLNRLGTRQTKIYGTTTLETLEAMLTSTAQELNVNLLCAQSNQEGALIDIIYKWADQNIQGIIFNPGAYAHTSVALRDAVQCAEIPTIEVHITNIYAREHFRHRSLVSQVCKGTISGLGISGYFAALHVLSKSIKE